MSKSFSQSDRVKIEQINRVATFVANNKPDLNSLEETAKTKALALADSFNAKKSGFVDRLEGFEWGGKVAQSISTRAR